jgi:hypothetical protein
MISDSIQIRKRATSAKYTAADIQREVHDALAKRTTVRAFSDVFVVWNPPGFLKLT